jgi:hypothetical protein
MAGGGGSSGTAADLPAGPESDDDEDPYSMAEH